LNSHQFGLHSAGSVEFQAAAQRIHGLLFGEPAAASSANGGAVMPAQAGIHAGHAGTRSMGARLRGDDGRGAGL
jgi:NitT/TauT family transport system ATP-binding protein